MVIYLHTQKQYILVDTHAMNVCMGFHQYFAKQLVSISMAAMVSKQLASMSMAAMIVEWSM